MLEDQHAQSTYTYLLLLRHLRDRLSGASDVLGSGNGVAMDAKPHAPERALLVILDGTAWKL